MRTKQENSKLQKSIYEQQTRSARRLTRGRMFLYKILVPLILLLARAAWGWCRTVTVVGAERIPELVSHTPSFIPVYWHQHQLFCAKYLLALRQIGVKLGFLISPSVDGEIGAMVVRRLGAEVVRGSSSHTGARALRDYYQALVQDSVSPSITPDGPRGPPLRFKPGAIILSQISQRPMIPLAFAASRAWKIGWDNFVIPMPLSRITIAVGEPVYVARGANAAALKQLQLEMEQRLNALFETARATLL